MSRRRRRRRLCEDDAVVVVVMVVDGPVIPPRLLIMMAVKAARLVLIFGPRKTSAWGASCFCECRVAKVGILQALFMK